MRLLHTPGFSEAASGGDSQRSGLLFRWRLAFILKQGQTNVGDALELESVVTPDIFVGIHRIDWDHHLVSFADTVWK